MIVTGCVEAGACSDHVASPVGNQAGESTLGSRAFCFCVISLTISADNSQMILLNCAASYLFMKSDLSVLLRLEPPLHREAKAPSEDGGAGSAQFLSVGGNL